jgi:hypothetical protein
VELARAVGCGAVLLEQVQKECKEAFEIVPAKKVRENAKTDTLYT